MPRSGDPYSGFNFLVDLGTGGEGPSAAFRDVTGIGASIDVVEYRVGNDPEPHTRKLPGLRKYSNVVLKRGLTRDTTLWDWLNTDPPDRRNVVIALLDGQRSEVMRFILRNAWPCKWTGPELDAESSDVIIETLELCHERLDVVAS
jgi:phage tail-like protein